jgi:hypothetical protein
MQGITVQEFWPARPPRRLFAHPTGTRAARRRLTQAGLRQGKRQLRAVARRVR